ncbi:MAG TPA: 50S ribosomal protein L30 [Saprospiraceae bacterium]|nr:50S ribosomal protein L30 [Saprospiraceae bacterium]HZV44527.1 50S ribosomal protein L30 [Saprospiraceae bacterium]
MAKIKVTQIKSQIDKSRKQKDTIKALGLGKINKSNVLESNAQIEGMLSKVAHLVSVEKIG